MKIQDWFRRRSRAHRRRKAAAENRHEPLREFVYLDEVSVFSLLASRIGALATDFTASESSSLGGEVRSNAGIAVPGAKAGVSSAVRTEHANSTQVMRKSTVQSTFKELYGYVRESLVLSPSKDLDRTPSFRQVDDVLREVDRGSDWVIDAADLNRGRLLEVEVQLEADERFQVSTILSTMMALIENMPQLPETLDPASFVDAVTATRLLEQLLAGLVPVRGKAIDYSYVCVDGRELVLHSAVLDEHPLLAEQAQPLYVVGVAEEGLFWRDIRRVLFTSAQYRMLCRLGRDGIQDHWTPVKIMDVLKDVVPALADIVDQIPTLLARMGGQEASEDEPAQAMRTALERYAKDLTTIYGSPLSAGDLAERGLPTLEQCARYETLDERRAAFSSLTDALTEELHFSPTPEVLAACRATAQLEAHLLAPGSTTTPQEPPTPVPTPRESGRYLDCEIVAVYW